MNAFVSIGYTKKVHGIKGELKVFIEPRFLEDFLKNERIFIDVRGTKVPYFIQNVRGSQDLIVALEEVDKPESAQALQSREIFLREKDILPDHLRELEPEEEGLAYAYLEGFLLVDQTLGELGPIEEVLDMPQQEMALLTLKGRDVLIPLNEALILSIDETGKKVLMDLPEGLV